MHDVQRSGGSSHGMKQKYYNHNDALTGVDDIDCDDLLQHNVQKHVHMPKR